MSFFAVHSLAFVVTTSMNVLWIRSCSTYSYPMTSHALGELAGSRRTIGRRADVMAAIVKVCSPIRNPTQSIDAYLYLKKNNPDEFHHDPIWNDRSLGAFFEHHRPKKNKKNHYWRRVSIED